VINGQANHLNDDSLHSYNLDGREFVKDLLKQEILFEHVIMNLPANASDFLDVFIGCMSERSSDDAFGMYVNT
jgi:tRNA G37 N-methylase Trm5